MRTLKFDSSKFVLACLPDTDPPPVTVDIEQVIGTAAAGNTAAAKELAASLGLFLYTLVLGEVLYEDDALDVMKDLFLRLRCGMMRDYPPRKGFAVRWIENIARMLARRRARRADKERREVVDG